MLGHIQSTSTWFMLPPLSDPCRNHEKYSLTVVLGWICRKPSIFARTSARPSTCSDEGEKPLWSCQEPFPWLILVESWLAMLKRCSSLILALVIGSSVLAGTVRPSNEHVCKMGMEMVPGVKLMDDGRMDQGTMDHGTMDHGMETMVGMESMPCCQRHATQAVSTESGSPGPCCVNIPQEARSSGTAFKLCPPAFSIAVIHPAVMQSPPAAPKLTERSYLPEVFVPNLRASYIRNHSFLI